MREFKDYIAKKRFLADVFGVLQNISNRINTGKSIVEQYQFEIIR